RRRGDRGRGPRRGGVLLRFEGRLRRAPGGGAGVGGTVGRSAVCACASGPRVYGRRKEEAERVVVGRSPAARDAAAKGPQLVARARLGSSTRGSERQRARARPITFEPRPL